MADTAALSPAGGIESADCFLGVARSLTGRRWLARLADERAAMALAQRLQVPEIVGRVLSARGVGMDEADTFLDPALKTLLPDPAGLRGMEEGAGRLAAAVVAGERIAVFGDYDVDGATSAALLARFFAAVGGRCETYIPDRLREGYGPNEAALLGLRENGVSVVVTVDCGTTSHGPLEAAAAAGLDVIVVDHHEAEARLPRAVAVINPNRVDETSPHGQLAAVGVAFLLVVGLNRVLRRAGWYGARPEPDLMQWLDLVALGTICDVVPLTGVNRALVAQGLKVMARRKNPGLRALADVAGMTEAPGTYHAGYILGPRINAGGRVGQADLGVRLLSTGDAGEADAIAGRLDDLNRERREIEAAVFEHALAEAEACEERTPGAPLIFAAGEGWHPGVIGIVASRLKERFNRPACVVSLDGGKGSGSGRSVSGVDLGAAVIAARQAGLLVKGGGHAMAAGFTVEKSRLDALIGFLNQRIADALGGRAPVPSLRLDGALTVAAASKDLISTLMRVGPFGSGNPEPRFAIAAARLVYVDVVGGNHLKCTLAGADGGRINAIAFRGLDSDLGPALLNHDGAPFHVAGRLRVNTWRGHSAVEFLIDDAAPAW
ncbi:MAG: single-stranded-DNA-specific exonuclease RecJ [Rhodospirillales bacterium]